MKIETDGIGPELLDDVKRHLRIDGQAEDSLILMFIDAAISDVEQRRGISIRGRNVEVVTDTEDGGEDLPFPEGQRYAWAITQDGHRFRHTYKVRGSSDPVVMRDVANIVFKWYHDPEKRVNKRTVFI